MLSAAEGARVCAATRSAAGSSGRCPSIASCQVASSPPDSRGEDAACALMVASGSSASAAATRARTSFGIPCNASKAARRTRRSPPRSRAADTSASSADAETSALVASRRVRREAAAAIATSPPSCDASPRDRNSSRVTDALEHAQDGDARVPAGRRICIDCGQAVHGAAANHCETRYCALAFDDIGGSERFNQRADVRRGRRFDGHGFGRRRAT